MSARRASETGANAETISDSGAVTALSVAVLVPRRAHRHRILADRNADAERRAKLHRDGAHRVVERGILAGMPCRRHPVGRELDVRKPRNARGGDVGDRFADRHAARGGRVDQRQRRALAHRHRLACVTVEVHQRDGDVRHRNLPGADHLIARAQAADGAIADGDEERLVGDGRKLQHAIRGVVHRDAG